MRPAPFASTLALVLLAASVAGAQADHARDEALKRFQEGMVLHAKGQEQDAYLKFAQAYAVVQTPKILFNLARTEQLTGRSVEAARHYHEFLASPPEPSTADFRQKATGFLGELDGQLGHIAIDAPTGTVIVLDDRPGAIGRADVAPGAHHVAGTLGPVTRTVDVTCPVGQTVTAKLDFATPAPPEPPTPSPVATGASAPSPIPATPGDSGGGGGSARTAVRWTATGIAAVSLGFSIGFDVASHGKAGDLSSYVASHPGSCGAAGSGCPTASQLLNSENQDATLAYVFFGVGVATAVGAAAAWLFWPDSKEGPRSAWLMPVVGPGGVGFSTGGAF